MKIEIEVLEVDSIDTALVVFDPNSNTRVVIKNEEYVTFDVKPGKPILLEYIDITPPDPDAVILGDTIITTDGTG